MKIKQEVRNLSNNDKTTISDINVHSSFSDAFKYPSDCRIAAMHFRVNGKAKRDPNDEYSDFGEKLAENRATLKMFKRILLLLKKEKHILQVNLDLIDKLIIKITKRINNQKEHIEEMTK